MTNFNLESVLTENTLPLLTDETRGNCATIRFGRDGKPVVQVGIQLNQYKYLDGRLGLLVFAGSSYTDPNTGNYKPRAQMPVHEQKLLGANAIAQTMRPKRINNGDGTRDMVDTPIAVVVNAQYLALPGKTPFLGVNESGRPSEGYAMILLRHGQDTMELEGGAEVILDGYSEENGALTRRIAVVKIPATGKVKVDRRHNDVSAVYTFGWSGDTITVEAPEA
ncbi:MAG: hypothetical protein GC134_03425 [Proteobacteria bacterium]|nr:hypothetical protein [Pseudomonadota bacterium]